MRWLAFALLGIAFLLLVGIPSGRPQAPATPGFRTMTSSGASQFRGPSDRRRLPATILSRSLDALAVFPDSKGTGSTTSFQGRATAAAAPLTGCSNATLDGAYGFEASGLLFVDTNTQPVALLGTVNFDAAGNGSGQVQISTGAVVHAMPLSAVSYSVNADCTGSVSVRGGVQAALVIGSDSAGSQEIALTEAGVFPPGVVTGSAKPLADRCSEATLDGNYLFSNHGWSVPTAGDGPMPTFTPTISGEMTVFDGHGDVQLSSTAAPTAGQFSQNVMAVGSYHLDTDCTGHLDVVGSADGDQSESLVVLAGGSEAWTLSTIPDEVVVGVLICMQGSACIGSGAGQTPAEPFSRFETPYPRN